MSEKIDAPTEFIWHKTQPSLRKWRLCSFKSVSRAAEISLAPLTVVVGANSAGKSSLIQSILLMAQNAVSESKNTAPQLRGQFELNSFLVQLGSMKESICDLKGPATSKSSFELGGLWFVGDRPSFTYFQRNPDEVGSSRSGQSSIERGSSEMLLDWELELTPLAGEVDNGIAIVKEAHAITIQNGISRQTASARTKKSSPGTDILRTKFDKFSFDHQASVAPHENLKSLTTTNADMLEDLSYREKREAVTFRSGLPVSGLKSVNILEYILNHQRSLYKDALRNPNLVNDPRESAVEAHISKHIFDDLSAAADFYVEEVARLGRSILQQDRIADDLNVALLARGIEQRLIVPLEELPLTSKFDGTFASQVETEKQVQGFLKLVNQKFTALHGDAEWVQESVLCSPDGRRSRTPIYAQSKTSRMIELWNRYLADSVVYLGPVRSGPRITYGLGSGNENTNIPIGESGEFLAKKMFNERDPKSYPILEDGKLKSARLSLEDAVSHWYHQICSSPEMEGKIGVDAPGRQGYQLNVGDRTLATIGFGISQLLPVLAICLSSQPGTLILLEEPESHLNPGLQQKLADFLLHMVTTGRQIIVETHSEYLITRLRRNAASEPDSHRYFGIIFAERDAKEGTSYRPVRVDNQGDLSEWPRGFFDHVADDLRVLMRKAAERKANPSGI